MDECDDGLPALRGDDILRDSHEVQSLSSGFDRLGYVDIHLVTIEISVEGSTHALVESQGLAFGDLDSETHHTDSMQTRLPVEDHDISVSQMPLHYVSHPKLDLASGCVNGEFLPVLCDDEIGSAAFRAAPLHALSQEIDRVLVDGFFDGENPSHELWDDDLVWAYIWVWRYDCPGCIVGPLPRKVLPKPSLFALEAGAERADILLFEFLKRKSGGVRVDVLAPMGLHQVPRLGYFSHVVALLNHPLKDLLIQKHDLLYFDSQVILVRQGVGQHDARSDTHRRDHQMIDDEVFYGCPSPYVHEDQLLLRNVCYYLPGFPGIQLKN